MKYPVFFLFCLFLSCQEKEEIISSELLAARGDSSLKGLKDKNRKDKSKGLSHFGRRKHRTQAAYKIGSQAKIISKSSSYHRYIFKYKFKAFLERQKNNYENFKNLELILDDLDKIEENELNPEEADTISLIKELLLDTRGVEMYSDTTNLNDLISRFEQGSVDYQDFITLKGQLNYFLTYEEGKKILQEMIDFLQKEISLETPNSLGFFSQGQQTILKESYQEVASSLRPFFKSLLSFLNQFEVRKKDNTIVLKP